MRAMMMAAVAAGVLLAGGANAQTQDAGQYQAALERMMSEAAQSRCPEDLMAPELLAACTPQIAQMGPGIQSLGAIESITYIGHEDGPTGRVERYAVKYAIGVTLNWGIGGVVDGKYTVAFAQQG